MDPAFRRGRQVAPVLALCIVAGLAATPGEARVVSRTVTLPSCAGGGAIACADTSFLSDTLARMNSPFIGAPVVDGAPATFATAFHAWDRAHGRSWRLVDGGALDLRIQATVSPGASDLSGGLSPALFTLSGGAPSLLDRLAWTQALVVNYTPLRGDLPAPIQTLDTFDLSQSPSGGNPGFPRSCAAPSAGASPVGGAFCGPIYPFQYGSRLATRTLNGVTLGVDPFYDAPQGDWPAASFEAITLLSSVTAPDTLTVYQGVAYGFALHAGGGKSSSSSLADPIPEPSTWAMALLGFAAFAGLRARARRGLNGVT